MKFLRAATGACFRGLALALVGFCHGLLAQDPPSFVAVGHGGRCVISRDGETWDEQPALVEADSARNADVLLGIAYGAGRFVAVGGGGRHGRIVNSEDGKNWQTVSTMAGPVSTIAFGNGRFVAFRGSGLMASKEGRVFQDGRALEWPGKILPRRSACGDTEAGFRFVVIGQLERDGETQPVSWRGATGDGERWAHAALDTAPANGVAYGAGIFVVVGPDGLIESSHDGQTWVRRSSTPGEELTDVVWTGNRFLVSGWKAAWSSADGFDWKREAEGLPCRVIWAAEKKGGIGLSLIGELYSSRDLAQWKKAKLRDGLPLAAVAGRE